MDRNNFSNLINDKKRIFLVVFVVLVPFLLILFSYKMFLSFADYGLEQKKVIDFLQDKASVDITSEEISHLEDVKDVMKKVDGVFYFLLLVCTLIVAYFYNSGDRNYLRRLFLYGGIVTFGLVVLFFIFVLIDFDFLFNIFHQIFFPQGGWIFSGDSFLIQTFPMAFFISMARKIMLLSLFLAGIFILGSIYGDMLARIGGVKAWVFGAIILGIIVLFFILLFFILLLPVIILLIIFGFLFFLFKRKKKKKIKRIIDAKFKVKK